MNLKDRIAQYLATGLKANDVAEIVGCSPGYISQLLRDEDYKKKILTMAEEAPPSEDEALNTKYTGLEHKIVSAMSVAVDGAELPHLTRALEAVSRSQDMREKRKNPLLQPQSMHNTLNIVSVALPAHAIAPPPRLTLNEKSEVVAIGERMLAPLSAQGVRTLFAGLQEKVKGENHVPIEASSPAPTDF